MVTGGLNVSRHGCLDAVAKMGQAFRSPIANQTEPRNRDRTPARRDAVTYALATHSH